MTLMPAPPLFRIALALSILSGALPRQAGADTVDAQAAQTRFFAEHCTKCHGPDVQKAKLRLDTLAPPTATEHRETWVKIAQAIEFGDMPPEKEKRPERGKAQDVARSIHNALATADGARPLALRRMNRVEYEHTLHDLLGIDVDLADLLPQDSSVQGFDNVADGLSISAVLMERYLEAADTAFEATIRRIKPLPPSTRRVEMMKFPENIASVKQKRGGTLEVENSFVKFTPGWPPVRLDDAHPIEDGMYECQIAVWPYQPNDRTLAVAIYVGPLFGPGQRRFVGMYDVTGTPADPRIIKITTFMKAGDTMHIVPWIFPEHITYRDKNKEGRPGIAVAWAQTHGPLDQDFPGISQKKLLGDLPMIQGDRIYMRHRKDVYLHSVGSENPKADIERILTAFIPRAFRRPVPSETIKPYIKLAQDRLDEGRTFEQAIRAGITAVLCSPHFLLLNQDTKVDDYTIASRLSYFLWSSLPDEELMQLASQGKLRDRAVLAAQAQRMMKDPRIERFIEHFTGQWLDLHEIEFTTPDKLLYPEFDPLLQESMLGETRGFFRHLLREDLSIMNFIDSDFTVLNERIARHYGINDIKGHENFRVVKLPESSIRGGILTHASVLKVTANGTSTSPILRGVWVIDRLLGQPAPPPPPGVPAVEPDIRGAVSILDQMEKHRANESCARCHTRIDPPGFALEGFDVIGGERMRYRSLGEGERVVDVRYKNALPVSMAGKLSDGRSFEDFRGFRDALMQDRDVVTRALATKLAIYGTGRQITVPDRKAIDAIVAASLKRGMGLRSMILAVIESDLFTQP